MNRIFLIVCFLLPMQLMMGQTEEDSVNRPVNPWVFTGNLDDQPGRIIVALNPDMWLAYDTVNCTMYRAWKGSAFVNTTPDSTGKPSNDIVISGFPYLQGDGKESMWQVLQGNKVITPETKFEGYEIDGNTLTFTYQLILPNNQSITVKESPEFIIPKKPKPNRMTLRRTFTVPVFATGMDVCLIQDFKYMYKKGDVKASSKFKILEQSKRMFDWGNLFNFKGRLILENEEATSFTVTYTIDPEQQAKTNSSR